MCGSVQYCLVGQCLVELGEANSRALFGLVMHSNVGLGSVMCSLVIGPVMSGIVGFGIVPLGPVKRGLVRLSVGSGSVL